MQTVVLVYRDERIVLIEVTIVDRKIHIANVYAPQSGRDKIDFFAHIQRSLENSNIKKTTSLIVLLIIIIMKTEDDLSDPIIN